MQKTMLLAALLLAGCGIGAKSTPNVAYFDLGTVQAAPNNRIVASLRERADVKVDRKKLEAGF